MVEFLFHGIFAFLAGILLNLTPCVLPVIPLKIRTILQEVSGNFSSRLRAATALISGSLLFFSALGFTSLSLGWMWGEIFQSKMFLVFLSIFLLFSALATFLGWSIRLPQMFHRFSFHRHWNAFFTGFLAGLLSTPCSGPFLGATLAFSFTQTPMTGFLVFVAIGLGLALPYFLILLWPGLLNRLPKGGKFSFQVERLLAFILLGAGIFFLQILLPNYLDFYVWNLFIIGLLFWSLRNLAASKKLSEKMIPLGSLFIGLWMVISMFQTEISNEKQAWLAYSSEVLQESFARGQPVLLEFTADWCINCKFLEKTVYQNEDILLAFEASNIALYQVDMTDYSEEQKKALELYGGRAIPYAVLFDSNGTILRTFSGIFTVEILKKSISQLSKKKI